MRLHGGLIVKRASDPDDLHLITEEELAQDARAKTPTWVSMGRLVKAQGEKFLKIDGDLAQEWGVARETAAHAMSVLEAEGLVRRYPGRGYYVTARA